jgi:uncharacterized membrane protein YphA (DoxX/SURF4 family)
MPSSATSKFTRTIGVLFLRVFLGVLFFFQGYAKIFWFKIDGLYASAFQPLEAKLPTWLLWATAYATSIIELVCGLMVIFGFWRNRALFALAGVVIVATIGHGIESGIVDLQHLFPRAILIALLLILPDEWDEWDVKHAWRRLFK